MKKVSFLKFRAKKRTFLKLETYSCTESGHQGARKWPPWCPEIPNSWTRTHIPFFARNFWKKSWRRTHIFLKVFLGIFQKNQKNNILKIVGSVHRLRKKSENCWRRTQIFMKIFLTFSSYFLLFALFFVKKIFWKKLEAYTDLEKNQKIVGDVLIFLWKIFVHFL